MIEDLSYVFRLPMCYIPSYMGNQIRADDSKLIQEENKNGYEPEDFESTVEIK
jgi:hypothetical protein